MSSFPTYEYMIFLHLFTPSLLYVYLCSFMHKTVVDCTVYQGYLPRFSSSTWSSTVWPCYSPPTGEVSFPFLWIRAEAEVMPLHFWGSIRKSQIAPSGALRMLALEEANHMRNIQISEDLHAGDIHSHNWGLRNFQPQVLATWVSHLGHQCSWAFKWIQLQPVPDSVTRVIPRKNSSADFFSVWSAKSLAKLSGGFRPLSFGGICYAATDDWNTGLTLNFVYFNLLH